MILYLGNKLSKHGYTPTSVETLGKQLEERFVIDTHSAFRNPVLRLFHMIGLVIKYRKADLLLIDTYSTWAFWYAVISSQLARSFNLSYTLILRGGYLPLRVQRSPFWSKIVLKNAKDVVCPSGYLAEYMGRFYDRQYQIIPNHIDLQNYPFKERFIGSSIRILWVRSFHEIYNPQLAVDIVDGLKQNGHDVQLLMVGPDKDGSKIKTETYAVKKGLNEYISFTGRLSKSEWITMAEDFDVFINTTNVDNTPVSVIEAMAMGMIVVSTNVGGMPYLLENSLEGLLVRPRDPSTFVENIEMLKANEELAIQFSNGARRKAENWDWRVVREKWFGIIQE